VFSLSEEETEPSSLFCKSSWTRLPPILAPPFWSAYLVSKTSPISNRLPPLAQVTTWSPSPRFCPGRLPRREAAVAVSVVLEPMCTSKSTERRVSASCLTAPTSPPSPTAAPRWAPDLPASRTRPPPVHGR
jgi:hypothetical protein